MAAPLSSPACCVVSKTFRDLPTYALECKSSWRCCHTELSTIISIFDHSMNPFGPTQGFTTQEASSANISGNAWWTDRSVGTQKPRTCGRTGLVLPSSITPSQPRFRTRIRRWYFYTSLDRIFAWEKAFAIFTGSWKPLSNSTHDGLLTLNRTGV